jgi:hypothetical protein
MAAASRRHGTTSSGRLGSIGRPTIRDYDDPLDTPLGTHVFTDLLPRLPSGWKVEGGDLHDVDRVFPLTTITAWLAAGSSTTSPPWRSTGFRYSSMVAAAAPTSDPDRACSVAHSSA